jgi:hypothetical protein
MCTKSTTRTNSRSLIITSIAHYIPQTPSLLMELILTPNNPERTVFVSPNGVAHYQVKTSKSSIFGAPGVSRIQRPADTEEDSIVAEIEWKTWGTQTLVRSHLLHRAADSVLAKDFLYKRGPFSSYVSPYPVLYFFSRDQPDPSISVLGTSLEMTIRNIAGKRLKRSALS